MSIKNFTQGLVSNRVLDLYLKYMGITTLTTATLVPLALIMGNTYFEDAVNYIRSSDQSGGVFLDNKIPVLDDELIGNYLKLSGLTLLNLSPNTLIPLGILMIIYNMFENDNENSELLTENVSDNSSETETQYTYSDELVGGSVTPLPDQYFNPDNSNECNSQTGSGRYIFGETIPPNVIQNMGELSNGRSIPNILNFAYDNDSMQLRDANQMGGSSDWRSSQMSRGPINSPDQPGLFKHFTTTADFIPNDILSNGASSHWNESIHTEHIPLYNQTIGNSINGVPTSQFGGNN